jgi:hypothetical protein
MFFDLTKPAFITVSGGDRFPIRVTEMIQDPNYPVEIRAEILDPAPKYDQYINALRTAYGAKSNKKSNVPEIKDVIFNEPATIVFWTDGTKTVVKAGFGEQFDPEKGLAMAIAKKHFGNEGNYYNNIKKWTNEYHNRNFIKEFLAKVVGNIKGAT